MAESTFVFSSAGVVGVNVLLALIMVGVGLDLDLDEVRATLRKPLAPAVGLVTQFLLLPAASYALIRVLDPDPAIALGMLVVASCPGGTVSNLVTHLGDGNTSLSIAMTSVSTLAALVMTPFMITFYGARIPSVAPLLADVSLDPIEIVLTLVLVLLLPVAAGIVTAQRRPDLAARLVRPMRLAAVVALLLIVVGAVAANLSTLVESVRSVALAVIAHNLVALGLGFGVATLFRFAPRDRRAITVEVGIQNSALALSLVFTFLGGLAGAALIAAFWGIWHIVSGLTLARVWRGRAFTA